VSLSSGTKLGPYEILSKIGAGGMGEVYRGRDTRLERTVAIKVLPSEFSRHAELRKRLEREARTLSSLSHPHICSLYDVGQQNGVDFLVMEYLEGETLEQRLDKGPLLADQVLRYGIEVADALERAHRHGIIHRDLKPGNIMLTKDGAKLLDFGLARAEVPTAPLSETVTLLETRDDKLTEKGVVLGTFQYMAPEQLEGKEADARTDIFALGAVIYEMATGKTAFSGNNRTSLITAILASEPPAMASLQPLTPLALERVVKICLAKEPDTRWQSAHDLKLQLQWIAEGGSQAGLPAPVASRRRSREKIVWALLALLTVAAVALGVGFLKRAPQPPPRISFVINPPPGLVFGAGMNLFAVSPDGHRVAFIPSDGQIWVQRLDEFAPRKLPGTDGAEAVFWSPDSRFIGFRANSKLKRIDPTRDRPEILCDIDRPYSTWNQDGIALAGALNQPITRLKIEDCRRETVTQLDSAHGEFAHAYPVFLPGGRRFLYSVGSRNTEDPTTASALYIGSLDSAEKRLLLQKASNAGYASGYLVTAPAGNLTAQALDLRHMQITGEAFPLREPTLDHNESAAFSRFSVSESGVLVYLPEALIDSRLRWVDRSGKTVGEVMPPGPFGNMRLSADGKNMLLARFEPGTHRGDLWKFDIDRKIWTRLTSHSAPAGGWAIFSPDQRRIAFSYGKSGDLYLKDADASGAEELLKSENFIFPFDWSPDGHFVLFAFWGESGTSGLWVISLIGDRKTAEIASGVASWNSGRFAPDGHSVVYVSERSGRAEVYLQRFPGQDPAWQVSREGGSAPRWSREGKEIFFLSPDQKMMSARVGPDLHTETAKPLFEVNSSLDDTEYEVAPDGRFLMLTPTEHTAVPLHVVMNWTADLKH